MKEGMYGYKDDTNEGRLRETTKPRDGSLLVIHTHLGSEFDVKIQSGVFPVRGHFLLCDRAYVKHHKVVNGKPNLNQAENIFYTYSKNSRKKPSLIHGECNL